MQTSISPINQRPQLMTASSARMNGNKTPVIQSAIGTVKDRSSGNTKYRNQQGYRSGAPGFR